jgi:SAM-dependent methyltransferase
MVGGRILNIGTGNKDYKNLFNFDEFITFDVDSSENPNIIGDIHSIPIKNDSLDSIICTQVLEHVGDPKQAVREMCRILKSRGILLLSVPFIYPIHEAPVDNWRFGPNGLKSILKEFKTVQIYHAGGFFSVFFELINLFLRHKLERGLFLIAKFLDAYSPNLNKKFTTGFFVVCKK